MALALADVGARRGGTEVLHDVSLELGSGLLGLLGLNGAGKSTLLQTAAGVLPPAHGTVRIAGCDPYARRSRGEAVEALGYVPQQLDFPGWFRLEEYLRYFCWLKRVPRPEADERVARALGEVGLADSARRRLRELSGGMHRRATIAQALLTRPAVLLLDEPTTGLDPAQRADLRALIAGLAAERAVVLATHIIEDVEYVADRVEVLHRGRIVFSDRVAALAALAPPSAPGDAVGAAGSSVERGFLRLVEERA